MPTGLQSFTVLVISPAAFTEPEAYQREVGSMLGWVRSSATLPGAWRGLVSSYSCSPTYMYHKVGLDYSERVVWSPRAGVESIRLPGERGSNALAECRVAGVPLSADKWAEVVALADGTEGLVAPTPL